MTDLNKVLDLIENSDLTLARISETTKVPLSRVTKIFKSNFDEDYIKARKFKMKSLCKTGILNPWYGVFGDKHSKYKGIIGDSKGYNLILKPEWYTGRLKSNHIFYHHLVVCKELGLTEIPKDFVVHHCDNDPLNNKFDNLVLMELSLHMKLHCKLRERSTTISKESTLKWVEAVRAGDSYDIV